MSRTIKVDNDGFERSFWVKVETSFQVFLGEDDERDEIPYSEAMEMAEEHLDYLAGSNDGSEMLANASVSMLGD